MSATTRSLLSRHRTRSKRKGAENSPEIVLQTDKEVCPPLSRANGRNKLLDVCNWLRQGVPGVLQVQNISKEELEVLLLKIQELGVKLRYDWDIYSGTLTLRMGNEIHEHPGAWLAEYSGPISDHLRDVTLCAVPLVRSIGSPSIYQGASLTEAERRPDRIAAVINRRSTKMPDMALGLSLWNSRQDYFVKVQDRPRVVLETSHSQSIGQVMEKTWVYLWEFGMEIHAVIVCDMNNINSGEPFHARIAVWVRAVTNKAEVDWPTDPCFLELQEGEEHPAPSPSSPNTPPVEGLLPPSTYSPGSQNDPMLYSDRQMGCDQHQEDQSGSSDTWSVLTPEDEFYWPPGKGEIQADKLIWRRSGWITVYHEGNAEVDALYRENENQPGSDTSESEPPALTLDVYDIMRVCTGLPNQAIKDRFREIHLPLLPLHQTFRDHVKDLRNVTHRRPTTIAPDVPRTGPLPGIHERGRVPPRKKPRRE
ncbi:hypothetical protein FRC11_008463 [Ceratobasidium sp. 423]|nr:hypothetical protein FRC11_008463 [Ceratobasidium sp. 423]